MNQNIFEKINSIVYKPPTHTLDQIKPGHKNLEIKLYFCDWQRFIVLKRVECQITKSHKKITKFWIADLTGSAFINLYDQDGDEVRPGDIYYMNGAYATLFKGVMYLHQGKFGIYKKTDEWNLQFILEPNFSIQNWEE